MGQRPTVTRLLRSDYPAGNGEEAAKPRGMFRPLWGGIAHTLRVPACGP